MSDPTYRIDVVYDPHSDSAPWDAHITRLSDNTQRTTLWAESREGAVRKAQEWIAAETNAERTPMQVFVDDDGRPVEGHSVKAT